MDCPTRRDEPHAKTSFLCHEHLVSVCDWWDVTQQSERLAHELGDGTEPVAQTAPMLFAFSTRQPLLVLRPVGMLQDLSAPATTVTLSSAAGIVPGRLDAVALTILGRKASPAVEASDAGHAAPPPPVTIEPAPAPPRITPAPGPEASSAVRRGLSAFLSLPLTFTIPPS